jgi:hypothetical protein
VGAVEVRGVHKRHRPGSTEKAPGSIHGMIEATGGFSPPERRRRGDARSPPQSGRRSPAGSLPENPFVGR